MSFMSCATFDLTQFKSDSLTRITVGPRGLKNGVMEVTNRRTGESEEMPPEQAVQKIHAIYAAI